MPTSKAEIRRKAKEVAAIRESLGLTQRALGDLLGYSYRAVQQWEGEQRETPIAILYLLRIWADKRCPSWAKPDQPK
jgi:DNA-binding transcriptional regulator YiaG